MKWNTHIENVCRKTIGILRFLKSSLAGAPFQVKLSLCRPIIKYSSLAWNPYAVTHSSMLEDIQGRTVKFIKNITGRKTWL